MAVGVAVVEDVLCEVEFEAGEPDGYAVHAGGWVHDVLGAGAGGGVGVDEGEEAEEVVVEAGWVGGGVGVEG